MLHGSTYSKIIMLHLFTMRKFCSLLTLKTDQKVFPTSFYTNVHFNTFRKNVKELRR